MVELVHPGNRILIDDGLIALDVKQIKGGTDIVCSVVNGGVLGGRKGISVPDVDLQMPSIGEKDRSDIVFGIEKGIDLIAASFVCRPSDVLTLRKLCADNGGSHVQIFSKIENRMGVNNFDEILKVSDGIMVARGDLGVEVDMEEVPVLQKQFIHKCNVAAKPVITATQMLDSMIRNPRPTRAEASDVANAIIDGTDAIMLSGETAAGKYPIEAVGTMVRIATYIGTLFAMAGFLYFIYIIIDHFTRAAAPIGWASTTALLLLLGGMILVVLGIMGEYVGRIYMCANAAPQYVEREVIRHEENDA